MSENNTDKEKQGVNLGALPVNIHAQYVKDISFENPNAPQSFTSGKSAPSMEMNIDMDAQEYNREKSDDTYEVILTLTAKASNENHVLFIAQVEYAALVSLKGVPKDAHHPLLLIEVPATLFPFARQILSDLTQNGGYPPLLLNPVDFRSMYVQRFGVKKNETEEKVA